MPTMTDYNPGDIVLVPFPFTDQTATKKRPAVVVSGATYQASRPDLIAMAITSQIHLPSAWGDVLIATWKEAGLIKPSVIKPVVATIEKEIVIRRLGQLHSEDLKRLRAMIQSFFG